MTSHERPGVYSAFEASSFVVGSASGAAVGLAALCPEGPDTVTRVYESESARAAFGAESLLCRMAELLLRNGACEVAAVAVKSEAEYPAAFALLGQEEHLPILVCDSGELSVQQALRSAVEDCSALRKERIAVVAAAEEPSALVTRAAALNSERMVLAAPALPGAEGAALMAAALAGAIAGESDPAVPLGGATLKGVTALSQSYAEETIDQLLRGGVTVAEMSGGVCSVVRGVTTRTKTGGVSDQTWRELTTIRVVDEVIPSVRNALRARFPRSKNTAQVRSAIRSQVVLELEEKLRREIITGYGEVTASAVAENPGVCLVEFSFTVAHGLNQIWLSARITV